MHTKQLREWINLFEAVDSNYLYHSTEDAVTAKAILSSGYLKASRGPQSATQAQLGINMPVVSFGRDLRYQMSGENVGRDYQVVFVFDRKSMENRYKTVATSQSMNVQGLPHADDAQTSNYNTLHSTTFMNAFDADKNKKISQDELVQASTNPNLKQMYRDFAKRMLAHLYEPKKGGEFEEVVPVKSGRLPWKPFLIGFYLVPGKPASQDPELIAHPLRLEMPRPNVFTKANPGTAT